MKDLQIFDNPQFGKIRAVEIDGEPWLIGKDVAEALGYKNTNDALATHVDDDDKRIIQRSEIATFDSPIPKDVFPANFVCGDIPTRGLTAINESGLYSLILSSKLPGAKKFKKWVTAEVLPRIRKEGGYIAGVFFIRGTACEGPAGRPESPGGTIRPHRRAGGGERGPDGREHLERGRLDRRRI